ncbi:NAD(P)H-dependent oxidoreductase [Fructobacillus papyrifericola]|uniref:NAD(P)H-dependent oxidoreductase n=1 Tax=Fructobacillus papyrifericola TaxID=2713172 RepID=A0ABS5QS07_9LACO|nr:NAD(P)H-dependent oxidoreductase [Fructobacillus papyrifericola]MBS9335989.1 NAD(P)H-dependent oxidoreductase [Fructobacillus papyrifericola]
MKLLVIQGHPDAQSFTHANAENYIEAAKAAGHEVQVIDLAKEDFDPILAYGYRQHMEDESQPKHYQELIKEADELAIFYPVWWAAEPAILKGFFDRTFTPGFAYHYESPTKIQHLLKGKTAKLFVTSRGPAWYTKSIFGSAVYRMKSLVLGFAGIKVKKTLVLGNMNTKKDVLENRQAFIEDCAKEV